MKRQDIVKVLQAAKSGPFNNANLGLLPGVVDYCVSAELVKAIHVTHSTSPHPEYILMGITSKGEDYIERSRLAPRMLGAIKETWIPVAVGVATIIAITDAIIHWLYWGHGR